MDSKFFNPNIERTNEFLSYFENGLVFGNFIKKLSYTYNKQLRNSFPAVLTTS